MSKRISLLVLFAIVVYSAFSGCGGGTSSDTISDKVWYTVGISIPMTSTNQRSCKLAVDAFAEACDDGAFLIDHTTPAIITLTRVDSKVDPGPLFLERYTVQYIPMQANSPVIEGLTVYQSAQLNTGENTVTVMVINVQRKTSFADLFVSGQRPKSILPVGYTVSYTLYGRNAYGQSWTYQAQAPIFLGDYNECAKCE